jgi:excisionase family DNA binding protein
MTSPPQATSPLPALATVPEVARYLSLSRSKVYQLMDGGRLPYVKLGRCRRVRWADVEALLDESRVGQSP